ncbi:MAG: glycoside hydrolase family 97 catalytic domain-containing protein [Oscillospiraceae bacterium]|nr:glycoside hydrolase family 97 catalytic domain-containing protein [Oscillospiraceae bacterium]
MKKILALALAVLMMLSLCACTEEPSGGSNIVNNDEPKTEITVVKKSSSGAKCGDTKLYALEELTTYSPDGKIKALFWQDEDGGIYYSVEFGKEEVITPSKLGITLSNCDLSSGIEEIKSYSRPDEIDDEYETAETIALENVSLRDHCMEREIFLKKGEASMTLLVRVYDDGFAYRYKDVTNGKSGTVYVLNEVSQINLEKDTTVFAGGYSATYEVGYNEYDYKALTNHNGIFNTPVTAYTGDTWMLFSESDAYANDITYIKSVLETKGGNPSLLWQFGFERDPANEVTDELASPGHIRISEVKTENGFTTPWRATIIASDLNGLMGSSLIDSLCPAMDEKLYKDTSWIKPGKVSWSWWSGENQHSYDAQIAYIDFASENGWEYCCLDAGWPSFGDRLEEMCDYAKKKGVGIIVWVNYLELKTPEDIEERFSKWSKAGVVGIKTDYFESDDIDVLESMRNCAEIGAEYKLMIYYHGCIHPCGETRTYPNIMTSEAVLGEEFRKWSDAPAPANCLMYPFTRNIVGSMDYTPSCIAIEKTGESGGFSLAKAIVYESSLQHFAASAKLFPSFIGLPLLSRIPTDWTTSTVIDGYPGSHITYVRSDGEDFYIGSMTLKKRSISVTLDFLGDGEYNAYIYCDNDKGKLELVEQKVKASDTLKFDLRDIGGVAVMITKDKVDTEVAESPNTDLKGFTYYECEDGKLTGSATVASSMLCSGGKKVGYVGNGTNNCEIDVEVDKAGEYELVVYYCTGEERNLIIDVNGEKYEVKGLTGASYDEPKMHKLNVKLNEGENTIKLTTMMLWAPDLDRIAISDEPVK